MTEAAIVFIVNIGTSFLKRWVYPKYGPGGVHLIAFALALVGSVYWIYLRNVPSVHAFVIAGVAIFVSAVAFYEVILQYFPMFKGPQDQAPTE